VWIIQQVGPPTDGVAAIRSQIANPGAAVHKWCEQHNEHHLIGSAVYVGRKGKYSLFLTAAHVVDDKGVEDWNLVPSLGGIGAIARAIVKNPEDDVAVLAVTGETPGWTNAATLASRSDYAFHPCLAYGHPVRVLRGHLSEGRVSTRWANGRHLVSSPIFFGNSGGGVYVQDGGRWAMLGVAQQILSTDDGKYKGLHVVQISSTEACEAALKVAASVLEATE
jgi:hypothetical protein